MEKEIRERTPIRHRFNWLDGLIIFAAVCFVVFIVLKFFPGTSNVAIVEDKKVTIEYTVQIEKINADIFSALELKDGAVVIDNRTKLKIGTLKGIPQSVMYNEVVYEEGVFIEIPSEKYVNIELTIVAEAIENEYGYYVNNKRIAVESLIDLRISKLEAEGKCIGIDFVGTEQ